jgi:hypothetical protein
MRFGSEAAVEPKAVEVESELWELKLAWEIANRLQRQYLMRPSQRQFPRKVVIVITHSQLSWSEAVGLKERCSCLILTIGCPAEIRCLYKLREFAVLRAQMDG